MNTITNRYRIHRRNILKALGKPAIPEPVIVDIEPSVKCNLRCPTCQRTKWDRTAPDMTPTLFTTILDSFASLDQITFQGMGEPLLNEHLFDLIAIAHARKIKISLFTNGTLLTPENVNRIIESEIEEVFVSCDHHDPQILQNIRPGLDLKEYSQGVRLLNEKANGTKTMTAAWTLLGDHLQSNSTGFVPFLASLGFRRLYIQTDMTAWGNEPRYARQTRSMRTISGKEPLETAGQIAADAAVFASIRTQVVATNSFTAETPCPWPFHHCYITSEGMVQPCCIISDPGRFTFGSLIAKPFFKIWNSSPYFNFRRRINRLHLHEFCTQCYHKNNTPSTAGSPIAKKDNQ